MDTRYKDEPINRPLQYSELEYSNTGYYGPKEGSCDTTKCPQGLSLIRVFSHDIGYGTILNLSRMGINKGEIQLFIPYNQNTSDYSFNMKLRSISDISHTDSKGWTPWREIAFTDQIDARINEILKAKGLI